MSRIKHMLLANENEFLKLVCDYALLNHWEVYHVPDSRRVTSAGFPDLVLARNGRVIFAELKTETGKMSKAQARWRDMIVGLDHHNEFFLWRPSDWGQIEEVLK